MGGVIVSPRTPEITDLFEARQRPQCSEWTSLGGARPSIGRGGWRAVGRASQESRGLLPAADTAVDRGQVGEVVEDAPVSAAHHASVVPLAPLADGRRLPAKAGSGVLRAGPGRRPRLTESHRSRACAQQSTKVWRNRRTQAPVTHLSTGGRAQLVHDAFPRRQRGSTRSPHLSRNDVRTSRSAGLGSHQRSRVAGRHPRAAGAPRDSAPRPKAATACRRSRPSCTRSNAGPYGSRKRTTGPPRCHARAGRTGRPRRATAIRPSRRRQRAAGTTRRYGRNYPSVNWRNGHRLEWIKKS